MKTTIIMRILLATVLVLGLGETARAEEPVRYIVILKHRKAATPEVGSLGGRVESRQDEQVVVSIPAEALAKLKADPAVLYVQRVGGGGEDETPLIGVPADPKPGGGGRFAVKPMGTIPIDLGTYGYDGAGNITAIGTNSYVYDRAQRLVQSTTSGVAESYTYDGFGNMKTRTNRTIPVVLAESNRYQGYAYNEIGAVTSGESYGFTYDAVGQPLSKTYPAMPTESYLYTASDERIGVERDGWWHWSLREEGGKVLRQYRSSSTNPGGAAQLWVEDFVWRDGLLLGANRPAEMGGRRHFHLDHLGTPRLVTSDAGQRMSGHDYLPFGDEQTAVVQQTAGGFDREEPLKFTGHERDFAGGAYAPDGHYIDYMHARYYSPTTGRFLSVDPIIGKTSDPQSWNRYVYARDSPIVLTDPTGMLFAQFTLAANALEETLSSFSAVSEAVQEQLRDTEYFAVVWTDGSLLTHEGIYLANTKTGAIINVWEHNATWSKPNEAVAWKDSLAYNKGWVPASVNPLGTLSVFGFAPRIGLVNRLNNEFAAGRLQCTDYSTFQQSPWKVGVALLFGHRWVSTTNEDHKVGMRGYVAPTILPRGFPR